MGSPQVAELAADLSDRISRAQSLAQRRKQVVLRLRNASHFGAPALDYATMVWPEHADRALANLDAAYQTWVRGVAALDDEGLARPVGPAEGVFAEYPYRSLVLHINREAIHHLAEVLVLRDFYRAGKEA